MKKILPFLFVIPLFTLNAFALNVNAKISFQSIANVSAQPFDCWAGYRVAGLPDVRDILEKGVRPEMFEFKSDKKYGFPINVVKSGHADFSGLAAQNKGWKPFEKIVLDFYNTGGKKVFTLTGTTCVIKAIRRIGANDRMTLNAKKVTVTLH